VRGDGAFFAFPALAVPCLTWEPLGRGGSIC
jgi:hypothetical protein